MADDDEQPTQVLSGAPRPPRGGTAMLEPHEPRLAEGGGGGNRPPYPPLGYGGDGGGDDGDGDDGDDGDRRVAILAGIIGILVVVVLFLVLKPGSGDENAPSATVTPTVTATAEPATTPAQEPDATPVPTATATEAAPTPTAEPNVPTLTGDAVTELQATQGDDVIFRVRNDESTTQEVHVHGYDKSYDVEPGETRTITFPATITGIFEIEFEATSTEIGELTVEP